jgi:ribA/ribD-fused uncharacterized protein
MEKFTFFWSGPYSNWHPSPFQIDGVWYNCGEQWMMKQKADFFGDENIGIKIMASPDPKEQKGYGRQVKNFDKAKWDAVARDIVYKGCFAKFDQNEDLKKIILSTVGTTLVEASPEDRIWGIGLRKTDPRALSRDTWLGTNWLGIALMKVREVLISK